MITAIRLSGSRRRAAWERAARRRERIAIHLANTTAPAPTIGGDELPAGHGWLGPAIVLLALAAAVAVALHA